MGKKNKHVLFLILFVLTAVSGCNNFNQVQDGSDADFSDKVKIVTFHYDYDGALPEKVLDQIKEAEKKSVQTNEKTAFPKMPSLDKAHYFVSLKNLTNGITLTSDTCDEITINYNERTISLPMASGNRYIVIVELRNLENKTLFSAADEVELTTKQTVYQNKFILQPSNEGEGCAALEIEYANNSETGSPEIFRVTNLKDASDVTQNFKLDFVSDTDGKIIKRLVTTPDGTTNGNIPSGAYKVEVEWRKTVEFNGNQISVRSFYISEVINIFANLNTTQWIRNDSNGYIDEQKNKIIITSTNVSDFEKSIFYVDYSAPESGTNGTFTKPFKTLKEAVTASENSNTEGMHYIHIKDGYSEEIKTNFPLTKNTSIECYKDRVGDGKGKAELIANNANILPLINLTNSSITELELSGFIFDGNNKAGSCDGTFLCANNVLDPNLKICLNDCEIKNFAAANSPGAINVTGNLYLHNCWIHDNCSKATEDDFKENPDYYKGAGIFLNENSSLYVSGKVVVKDNKCINSENSSSVLAKSNIFLQNASALSVSALLKIEGVLSDDSEICISGTGVIPSGSDQIKFGENWNSSYGPVSKFIKSDDGFAVLNKVSGDIFLAVNGGGVDIPDSSYREIIFKTDKDVACYIRDTIVKITTQLDSSPVNLNEMSAKLYSKGRKLATLSYDDDTRTVTIPKETYCPGLYQIVLTGTYEGRKYSSQKNIEVYVTDDLIDVTEPDNTTYEISTAASMKKIADWVNGETYHSLAGCTFKLIEDIELPPDYEMIGKEDKEFQGTFDGNGHSISINGFAYGTSGIFGDIKNATIKNVDIEGNIAVTEGCYLLAKKCSGTTLIENCVNSCNVKILDDVEVCGFVRELISEAGSFSEIRKCHNKGNFSTNGSYGCASGICILLQNTARINCCTNTGNIADGTYAFTYASGIVNSAYGDVVNTFNAGKIKGVQNAAGIASVIYCQDPYGIKNCYNIGNVSAGAAGAYSAGGIAGENGEVDPIIKNCWNKGTVSGGGSGAILGKNSTGGTLQFESNFYLRNSGTATPAKGNPIEIGFFSDTILVDDNSGLNFWIKDKVPYEGGSYLVWKLTCDGPYFIIED